ncbi:MAG: hypothetical protein PVH00_05485 [Gemmatimonadota bacterium]|jgi:hypothetical protein
MNDEHRFDEDEVAEILQRATSPEATGSPARPGDARGVTLAQLQEIGAEVGIDPARIAEAANVVTSRGAAPAPPRVLGAPRSVSRSVPIPRPLTDDEWTRLVVDLRETFGAQGMVSQTGTLRSWSNGNLEIHVEPEGDHYRVRMRTIKGDAPMRTAIAAVILVMAAVLLLSGLIGDGGSSNVLVGSLFGAFGLYRLGGIRRLLKRWAAERAEQMEGLAERIPRLLKRAEPDS